MKTIKTWITSAPLIFFFFFTASLISCKHPIVGKHIDYRSQYICSFKDFPVKCEIGNEESDELIFDFEIEDKNIDGEYSIEGGMTFTRGDYRHFDMAGTYLMLVLIKDGVIFDTVTIHPMSNNTNKIRNRIQFKRKFKSEPFDAVTIYGHYTVVG